jgi:hypothetical protein
MSVHRAALEVMVADLIAAADRHRATNPRPPTDEPRFEDHFAVVLVSTITERTNP